MRLLTWNIQNRPPIPPYEREEALCEFLRAQHLDLLFLQEIPSRLLAYLSAHMEPREVIGVGRDDGEKAGEFVPILILSRQITVHRSGWFWLGPTPDIPSRAWFALCPRLCTWALLEKEGRTFFVVNNHWDHFSFYSRKKGWQQVLEKWVNVAPHSPALFTGDFNLRPSRSLFKEILTNPHRTLKDFWAKAQQGPLQHTFTGFGKGWGRARFDHFLGTNEWAVKECEILPSESFLSDHRPLLLQADLP